MYSQLYLGEEKSIVRMNEKLMTLMRGGWDGEGKEGIKREGGREKRECWVLLMIVGLVVIFWTCCVFGDLRNLWRFCGGWEEWNIVHLGLDHSSWTRTLHLVGLGLGGLGNLWRFPGLGIYFLVGWEVNPVGSARRSVQLELSDKGIVINRRNRYFSMDYSC